MAEPRDYNKTYLVRQEKRNKFIEKSRKAAEAKYKALIAKNSKVLYTGQFEHFLIFLNEFFDRIKEIDLTLVRGYKGEFFNGLVLSYHVGLIFAYNESILWEHLCRPNNLLIEATPKKAIRKTTAQKSTVTSAKLTAIAFANWIAQKRAKDSWFGYIESVGKWVVAGKGHVTTAELYNLFVKESKNK